MNKEIENCPFCGSKAETQFGWQDRNVWHVVCNNRNCGCMTDGFNKSEEAIEIWNRRIKKE